jgi:hypothetical protein
MKKIIVAIMAFALLNSCSSDAEVSELDAPSSDQLRQERLGDVLPRNSDNSFDLAGILHNEIAIKYYDRSSFPTTTSGIAMLIDSLANLRTDFLAIKGANYQGVPVQRIDYLIQHRDSCIDRALQTTLISARAQLKLRIFVNDLENLVQDDKDYSVIYSFITLFESKVISDTLLSAKDKEVVLTTTSIARHSAFLKKKKPKRPRDPDWDWLTANVMSGTDGAAEGTAEAVTMAVVAGIADND